MKKGMLFNFSKKMSGIQHIPLLDELLPNSKQVPSAAVLSEFKKGQRLAYRCAETIAKELRPGWTEKQAAKLMDVFLKDHGIKSFFHKSFAWYGDRTRFAPMKHYWDFMPSNRELQETDVVILDTAPIYDGHVVDIGYTTSLVENPKLEQAKRDLMEFRRIIPKMFEKAQTTATIWDEVDRMLKKMGYDNCHERYPLGALGHRVPIVKLHKLPGLTIPFSVHALYSLISRGLFNEVLGPYHEGDKIGLWAIEPHIGGDGFGAKFEEILVVNKDHVYWLDDNVPHNLDREE